MTSGVKSIRQKVSSGFPQLLEILKPRRGLLGVGLILLLVNRISGLAVPYAPKVLLDRGVVTKDPHFLLLLLAGLIFAALVQGLTSFALGQLFSKESHRVIAQMRRKLQAHVSRLPVSYFDSNKSGVLVSRIMTDAEGVRSLVGVGFVEFAGSVVTAILVIAILVRISPLMTVVSTGFLLVFAFCWRRTLKVLRPLIRDRGALTAELSGRLTESLGGIRVVKGYHAQEREQGIFSAGVEKLLQNLLRSVTASSFLTMASAIVLGILSAVVLSLGCMFIIAGKMTVGDLFSYMLFMGYVSAPVIQLTALGPNIIEALASLDRTREVLSQLPEDEDPARTLSLPRIEGLIRFENVLFEYELGKPALIDISFEALPGSVTALVGSSGSGKSTIIGLVAAFYRPTGGRVLIDGVNLSDVRLDCYRPKLGVVFQESFLFAGTIRDNVSFARPDATDEEVLRACRIAHVDEFADRFRDGYETMIGERGVKLSGGQRQRVSIARAILADPRILILDEATSSLDSESEAFIQEGLKYLMQGRTTFVIAHRLFTVRHADQILVVEGGQIVERGTHDSLRNRQGRYSELYAKQHYIESNLLLDPAESFPGTRS